MKLIRNRIKQDPIKAAAYNPKEFRGRRSAETFEQPLEFSRSWRPFILLVALTVGAWYLWKDYASAPAAPLPATGEVQRFSQDAPNTIYGPFQLRATAASAEADYLVKLEDWQTGAPILTVFVRRGEVANIKVPLGTYRAKYAFGTKWYGPQHLFGSRTKVAQALMPLSFTLESNQVRGKVNDFTQRITGNLKTVQGTKTNF